MNLVKKDDFTATTDFRKLFNGFYRVRQKSSVWYDKYYKLMEEQKINRRNIVQILKELYSVKKSIEVSFASKLIATINPDMPIWDQYVLKNLELDIEWEKYSKKSYLERVTKAGEIYQLITDKYDEIKNSEEGQRCLLKFDEVLPQYANIITDTKKIDYLLWSKR